jgi:excisionase family DNA binding protein
MESSFNKGVSVNGWAKIRQAARYAGVSERTLREWIHAGLKHARLPSGHILVKFEAIDEFLTGFVTDEKRVDRIVEDVLRGMAK